MNILKNNGIGDKVLQSKDLEKKQSEGFSIKKYYCIWNF